MSPDNRGLTVKVYFAMKLTLMDSGVDAEDEKYDEEKNNYEVHYDDTEHYNWLYWND